MRNLAKLGWSLMILAAGGFSAAACDDESSSDDKGRGGSGNLGGQSGFDLEGCVTCGDSACPTEKSECDATAGCKELRSCTLGCANGDTACQTECANTAASNYAAATAAANYLACAVMHCASECTVGAGTGVGSIGGFAGAAGNGSLTGSGGTGSGQGGTPPVTYHCEGTRTISSCSQCSGTNPSCNCFSIPGCDGTTDSTCSGTVTEDCEYFDIDFPTCAEHGCEVGDGGCYAPTCASLGGTAQCSQLAGCVESNFSVTCYGTPTPCSALGESQCKSTGGCSWVSTK